LTGLLSVALFFFFQAEDGIRDLYVTGVQTCALPICQRDRTCRWAAADRTADVAAKSARCDRRGPTGVRPRTRYLRCSVLNARDRSEERRVGKECRSRWSPQRGKRKGGEARSDVLGRG